MQTANAQAKEGLGETLGQSKQALDQTIRNARDALNKEQRAWVAGAEPTVSNPEVGKPMKATIAWINSGKTFAKGVEARSHLKFVAEPFGTGAELEKAAGPTRLGSIGVISPGAVYKTPVESYVPISEIDKSRIASLYTYLWAEVSYFDVSGIRHETLFCSYRKGTEGEFLQCPFHNDAN